jgi:pSer/pThr/pTyr-binding forkhead associated (FHA) protein
VKDPVISRFAEACGATGPLDLRVDLAEGGVLAEGTVPMPLSLIGRDDACDVTLTDSDVNPRHAWLQVIAGRVFALDLGSRTGLGWPGGSTGSGWLDVGIPMRVGPFNVRLRSPVAQRPLAFPLAYNPLVSDPNLSRLRPTVALEFRNGKRAKDRWTLNRLVTPIGRAPDCKIRLTADDIAGYHCGLVLTPDGLWVVDLSGRGVVVNGERMRVSPLRHGAELWIGRFLIGVQYPAVSATPANGRTGLLTPPTPLPGLSASASPRPRTSVIQNTPEDEVDLGAAPIHDSNSGLPSSHIMADAFRLWGTTGGPVSNPILVSGSGAIAPAGQEASTESSSGRMAAPHASPSEAVPVSDDAIGLMLRQLGEIHGQMLAQFQQSLVLMVQLFGTIRRDQYPAMQRELARIQELNTELAQFQAEVARRAAEAAPAGTRTPPPRVVPVSHPAHIDQSSARPGDTDGSTLQAWVLDRINALQQERQSRWQALVGMFSEKNAG